MGLVSQTAAHILLVGDGPTADYLESLLKTRNWRRSRSASAAGVLQLFRTNPDIDVVLIAPGPDLQPYTELTRQIKFDRRTAFVAVILVLTPGYGHERATVLAASADECLQLPARPDEILLRLSNAYRMKRMADSLEDSTAVITSLANAIEGRDAYTRGHVDRVSTYAVRIGQGLGLSEEDLAALRIGGVVHDVGKVAVPDHLLNKPGRLTDEEMDLVRLHPIVGHDVLQPLRSFRSVLPIVRWHHERPNGTGYPDHIGGDDLPLLPRIVAVADVFDALSTARSYRPAFGPEEYRGILVDSAAKGELDPDAVKTLFQFLDESAATFRPQMSESTPS